jgi:uncharacterized protein YdeI (YjbR/CyaY-like superfamily)
MDIGKTVYFKDRKAWRVWLQRHHATAKDIWLIYYNKASGKPRIPYADAVEEALCFGWIDSIVKKIDVDRTAQRYTPRRKGAPFSQLNKERARKLIRAGQMTSAGMAHLGDTLKKPFVIPADIVRALKRDPAAWKHFSMFPKAYQRVRVAFIEGARHRPEIFKQRLAYFLKMTAQGKRFGSLR